MFFLDQRNIIVFRGVQKPHDTLPVPLSFLLLPPSSDDIYCMSRNIQIRLESSDYPQQQIRAVRNLLTTLRYLANFSLYFTQMP